MKKGTTSIQNIEPETRIKFIAEKLHYQSKMGKELTNDEFLQELLK